MTALSPDLTPQAAQAGFKVIQGTAPGLHAFFRMLGVYTNKRIQPDEKPDNMGMVVVTEELSRGYIGVGSLGTRSEIAAELHDLEHAMADPDRMDEMDALVERYSRVQLAAGSPGWRSEHKEASGAAAGDGDGDEDDDDVYDVHVHR